MGAEEARAEAGEGRQRDALPVDPFDGLSSADEETDEHCGRNASQLNLRQLRLSALEDVLVCDQRRHNTKAARRLFHQLANSAAGQRAEARKRPAASSSKQKGSSLSSRSSCGAGDNHSDDELDSAGSNQLDGDYLDELLDANCNSGRSDDCGLIKLDRRCCSSSSSSSVNFGRTLVCSLSPTGQFNFGAPSGGGNSALNPCKPMNIHERAEGANQEGDDDDLNYYAIDGDEIRHCRAAFRENRRLIEQVQSEACRRFREADGGSGLRRAGSQATVRPDLSGGPDRRRWADSLGRRSRPAVCARCQQTLYPVDKMELDFTRATLNIHRNCFKCQVCATLLRLETYASIDAKLYCPAHTKRAAPSR